MRHRLLIPALLAVLAAVAACGDDGGTGPTTAAAGPTGAVIDPGDGGRYAPELDPARFVAAVDNPYWPLAPGSRWVFTGPEGERVVTEVVTERRTVAGISAVVVHDQAFEDDELVEDTWDWYAQDVDGNVWYLGEDTKEYEDGEVVSTAGSWEAGVDGAYAGIVMRAAPAVGDAYRQEYDAGEAEDMAEVLRTGQTVTAGGTEYTDVIVTREWSPLEPDAVEEKFYAPGVGVVLAVKVAGGEGREELVGFTPGA